MRRQSRTDARRSLAFLDERGQVAFEGFEPRIEVARTEQRPHPRAIDRIENRRLRPVHVHDRRHAAQQHFGRTEQCAHADVVVGLARFERPDMVVEPLHEGHIVGIAALERHGHVAMGIHQSGHQDSAPAVDLARADVHLTPRFGRSRIGRHQCDAASLDADVPVETVRFAGCRRHRQHLAVSEKQCHNFFTSIEFPRTVRTLRPSIEVEKI